MDGLRFGYVRVSHATEDAGNLATQRKVLTDYGVHEGLIFADTCKGATPPARRPGWTDLLGRIASGDSLVVKHPDRLARSALDGLMMLRDLGENGVTVVVTDFGGGTGNEDIDRLMMQQALVWAEWFAKDTSRRIKEGHARARAQGKAIGRPSDYADVEFMKGQARRMHSNGLGPTEIARRLSTPDKTVPRSTVRRWVGWL